MTEDEKKEFEEFLQWKKEKQKKLEQEQQQPEKQDIHSEELEETDEEQEVHHTSMGGKQQNDIPQNSPHKKNKTKDDKMMIAICLILLVCFVSALAWEVSLDNKKKINKTENNYEEVDSFNLLQEKRDSILQAKADSAKASADSIRKAKRINLLKHSVRLTTAHLSSPNSAGGVDAIVRYKNLSNKTIKYFYWKGYAKNAVGDIVLNEIGGEGIIGGKDTGPIKHGKSGGGCWSCVIYNWTAKKLVITEVTIEYMDGTELKISSNEIKYIK